MSIHRVSVSQARLTLDLARRLLIPYSIIVRSFTLQSKDL